MFDPVQRAEEVEKIVARQTAQGQERLYARFRGAGFYGGIATADCCGCNLLCKFCWAWRFVTQPTKYGKFYSAQQVVQKLIAIAEKRRFSQIRLTGAEPTITKQHLLSVIEKIPSKYLFILETNGILIGHDKEYATQLSRFKNLHVRVSLKGSSPDEFALLTGALPEAFQLQLKALENLEKVKVRYHPAVIDLVKDLEGLEKELAKINPNLPGSLEIEPLIKYPAVVARLKKAQIL